MRCVILGGGGHAQVVIDTLQESGTAIPEAVLDANRDLWGKELSGVAIRGGDELLATLPQEGVSYFVVGLGGIGDNSPRKRLYERAVAKGLKPLTVIHPSAVVSQKATVGEGSVVFAQAVLNAGAVIGKNVIVNTGAIVEHDCVVGDHVHIATGARLAGAVCVGEGAHVGAGATLLQGVSIGEKAIVAAGAMVVKDVPAQTVVAGVPANFLKDVSKLPASLEASL